jgi:protein-tyrosine-phosphatase
MSAGAGSAIGGQARGRDLPGAVLFACTINAIRSPMAAAILKHLTGRRVYVESAGVRPGEPDPFVAAVMEEIGIDLTRHAPHSIADLGDTSFDLIVTLSPEAHHQALELTRTMAVDVEYWPTLDPSLVMGNRDQILDAYRAVRDGLFRRIKARFGLEGGPTV